LIAIATLVLASPLAAQTGTVVTFPWDWHVSASPNLGTPGTPDVPGEPVEIWLWGEATIAFGEPVKTGGDPNAPETFDLGPGGGLGAPTAEPVPDGGIYTIPIQLVAMDLHSMGPVEFPGGTSDVILRLDPSQPSGGALQNVSSNPDGTINVDSFFDVFFAIDLPQAGMQLTSGPVGLGMSFGDTPGLPDGPELMRGDPLPQLDVLWAPTWIWREFPPGTSPPWVDSSLHPWDWWVTIHGHVTVPEPGTGILLGAMTLGAAVLVGRHRRR
jgi:hypothetical protein